MSRRIITVGGGVAVAGIGYYLYQGMSKFAIVARLPVLTLGQPTNDARSKTREFDNEASKKVAEAESKAKQFKQDASSTFDSSRKDASKKIDEFDNKVEKKTSEAKSGISSWLGFGK
ncbi:uncharacterized protein KY384_006083 [Bacidia gigantensis]|uniref:uncharacterized protein n=1 Tax=Bacidia gigantensis TaxID=2732470 RepID=UPI001D04B4E5|nr:uncharacterized protein KY384_006083 [Bacidia gigantensis]KAG8529446.1 hypothetical protein KY384_006083 [Bacidia gigantensis]